LSNECALPEGTMPAQGADVPVPARFVTRGFLFRRNNRLYRQVNSSYGANHERLMESGLYRSLTDSGLVVPHEETDVPSLSAGVFKVIAPELVPFISYACERCFSRLRDAARHLLAPLALVSHTEIRLGQLTRVNIDGIPLDLASRLLPGRTKLSLGLATHIHLHAQAQRRYADKSVNTFRLFSKRLFAAGYPPDKSWFSTIAKPWHFHGADRPREPSPIPVLLTSSL